MNPVEAEILAALVELEQTVKSDPLKRRAALPPLFARLDDLTRQLPPNSDPDLLHFMHRASYEKARLLLEGRGEENRRGTCD